MLSNALLHFSVLLLWETLQGYTAMLISVLCCISSWSTVPGLMLFCIQLNRCSLHGTLVQADASACLQKNTNSTATILQTRGGIKAYWARPGADGVVFQCESQPFPSHVLMRTCSCCFWSLPYASSRAVLFSQQLPVNMFFFVFCGCPKFNHLTLKRIIFDWWKCQWKWCKPCVMDSPWCLAGLFVQTMLSTWFQTKYINKPCPFSTGIPCCLIRESAPASRIWKACLC